MFVSQWGWPQISRQLKNDPHTLFYVSNRSLNWAHDRRSSLPNDAADVLIRICFLPRCWKSVRTSISAGFGVGLAKCGSTGTGGAGTTNGVSDASMILLAG
jgi:hypothetical protein